MEMATTAPHIPHASPDGARTTTRTDCVPMVTVDIDAANRTMFHSLTVHPGLLPQIKGALLSELLPRS